MHYLRRNWRDVDEIDDLRQEVYERVFDAAAERLPQSAAAFVRSVARNLLIDRARRRLTPSVTTAGMSIATASVLTSVRHRSATIPHTSVAARCQIVSVDSTSLRDIPR